MSAPAVVPPRYIRSGRTRTNAEKWSWIYMRVSGVLLLVLVLTHLFVNLMTGDGINQVDFAFVAGKWASPLWQWWDFAMLVLAMVHGGNGMRLLINDYARTPWLRKTFLVVLTASTTALIVLGSLVIWTFDACPVDAPADLIPSFCEDVR